MRYLRVNATSDQTKFKNTILIANELYTENELKGIEPKFINKHFKELWVSKFKTYFFFGARFTNAY